MGNIAVLDRWIPIVNGWSEGLNTIIRCAKIREMQSSVMPNVEDMTGGGDPEKKQKCTDLYVDYCCTDWQQFWKNPAKSAIDWRNQGRGYCKAKIESMCIIDSVSLCCNQKKLRSRPDREYLYIFILNTLSKTKKRTHQIHWYASTQMVLFWHVSLIFLAF